MPFQKTTVAKVCPYGIVSVLCGQNGRGLMEAALSTKIEQPQWTMAISCKNRPVFKDNFLHNVVTSAYYLAFLCFQSELINASNCHNADHFRYTAKVSLIFPPHFCFFEMFFYFSSFCKIDSRDPSPSALLYEFNFRILFCAEFALHFYHCL